MRHHLESICVVAVLALSQPLGCAKQPQGGGAQGPPGAVSEGKPGEEPAAQKVPWSRKTREQRMEYMSVVVYPKMKQIFQEHDPKSYAEFKCQTCHGDDMEAVDFKMPNSLYALPADKPVEAAMDYDSETATFMMEKVVPTMADLLEMDQAFGCFNCHQKE